MVAAGRALDWQSVTGGAGVVSQDGTGATDDTFQAGSKEQLPSGWALTHSPSSPGDDAFFAARDVDFLTSHVFLNLGSILKAANGTIHASFELNQLAPGSSAAPTYRTDPTTNVALPARTTGDALLAFDTSGGGARIGVCTWSGDHDSGQWLLLNGTALENTSDKACSPLDAATAQGTVNQAGVLASSNYISHQDVTAGNFGELSVDLTNALAAVTGGQCVDFQSFWLRTRSSIQVNSNPEDVVLPRPIDASNCPRAVTPTPSSGGSEPTVAPGPTGERAAALKKCKHKHGEKRRKCKRRANRLPV
jgi:hypothetical protein